MPSILYQTNRGHPKAARPVWLRPERLSFGRSRQQWSRFGSVLQAGIKQVVLPGAVDAQIFARVAFAHEAGILQKPGRTGIARDARRLDPMQPQRRKGERNDGA